MTDIALNELSLKELKQLQREVEKAIASFEDRQKSDARAELEEHAKRLGFTLAELAGVPEVKKVRSAVAPKYRHPENAELTWSGRGRKPLWFGAAIASGKSVESLAI